MELTCITYKVPWHSTSPLSSIASNSFEVSSSCALSMALSSALPFGLDVSVTGY